MISAADIFRPWVKPPEGGMKHRIMGKNKNEKIGAVLVQGGGIAGVQASLDLANSGFKVYLVEREAAIGGMMSHLDKTFPTGDCATCIVSPKLVECARNLNIEILTLSELVGLEGEPGRISRPPSEASAVRGRGQMHRLQRMHAGLSRRHPDDFNRGLGTRKGIAKLLRPGHPNILASSRTATRPAR